MAKAIQQYLGSIQKSLQAGNATEHSYRAALQSLVESFDKEVDAVNEPKRVACGAPDFIVSRQQRDIGYIECKDIGVSLDEIEKTEQLQRYFDGLDNLILTNYLEFRYYIAGEIHMQVKLSRVPEENKKLRLFRGADDLLTQLFEVFFSAKAEAIRTPRELAEKLANVAQIIRDAIAKAFVHDDETASLHALFQAFRQTILHDITHEQFADMYAQTVCYGMFSARVNVPVAEVSQFSRKSAASDLPATNPFLRDVFEYIAGTRLNASIVWAVDLLASVLRDCDMEEILRDFGKAKLQEDPVVHFYESFLAAYDATLRESRGVYYTPEPVVNYIVRSVDTLLKRDFGCKDGLADNSTLRLEAEEGDKPGKEVHRVQILDPAAGTGTFLFETVKHIYEALAHIRGAWTGERGYVAEHLLPRLHGFELMMAPYAVAHMKLGWLLKETGYDFPHNERLKVYLTNTLEEAEVVAAPILLMADQIAREANAASNIKTDAPIMVVLGNPPYSGHSANNNQWSKDLIKEAFPWSGGAPGYFECDGNPLGERNPKWLNDDYVKFIRFGQYRIERTGYGVLAFVTNHGYLDNPTFRGMRRSLMHTFDEIYVLDLHGNTKKREVALNGSRDDNVFDIQQGVAIGIFVKKLGKRKKQHTTKVFHADLLGVRRQKYEWLDNSELENTDWKRLKPTAPFYLFTPQDIRLQAEYQDGWKIGDIMPVNSVGIVTARDHLTIKHRPEEVWETVRDFAKLPAEEAREQYNLGKDVRDWKVKFAQEDLLDSGLKKVHIQSILYRPFDARYTYYTKNSRGFLCMPRYEVMRHMLKGENVGICTTRSIEIQRGWEHIFCTNQLIQHHSVSLKEVNYLFPLYIYPNGEYLLEAFSWPEGKDGRRPNLAPKFIQAFSARLALEFITEGRGDLKKTYGPEDVFAYIYAVLHSPSYRDRYTPFLKIDFPRIPLTSNRDLFARLVSLGAELVALHLLDNVPTPEAGYPEPGENLVDKPHYKAPMEEEEGRVYINNTQYFAPVPAEVWEFQVGGYQVCEKWLKDRKGHKLDYKDIEHYRQITEALRQTLRLMAAIDAAIPEWPLR